MTLENVDSISLNKTRVLNAWPVSVPDPEIGALRSASWEIFVLLSSVAFYEFIFFNICIHDICVTQCV
jgi:hypothetical protein